MELNLCPGCDAFIRNDWTDCLACGHRLIADAPVVEEEIPEPEQEWAEMNEVDVDADGYSQPEPEWAEVTDIYSPEHEAETAETADPEPEPEPAVAGAEPQAEWAGPEPDGDEVEVELGDGVELGEGVEFGDGVEFGAETNAVAAGDTPVDADVDTDPAPADETEVDSAEAAGFTLPEWVLDFSDHVVEPVVESVDERAEADNLGLSPMYVSSEATPAFVRGEGGLVERIAGSVPIPVIAIGVAVVALVAVAGFATFAVLFLGGAVEAEDGAVEIPVVTTVPETTTTTLAPNDWAPYTDPAGRFVADFPGTARVVPVASGILLEAPTPEGNATVDILTRDLPPGHNLSKNDNVLRDLMKANAAETGTVVKSTNLSTVSGVRQLNARMVSADKQKVIDARYFVSGNTLYGLYVVSSDPNGDPKSFSRLTDGFKPAA